MIEEQIAYSSAGYTIYELKKMLEMLCVGTHQGNALYMTFQRILKDINDFENDFVVFKQEHILLLLATLADVQMVPLVETLNMTKNPEEHLRLYGSFTVLHLLRACTGNPHPRYTSLDALGDYLRAYVDAPREREQRSYIRAILSSYARYCKDGVYKNTLHLKGDILKYIEKTRESARNTDQYKESVHLCIEACCFILTLI